jgi:hypothetical protein
VTNLAIINGFVLFLPFTVRVSLRHILTLCARNLCVYLCTLSETRKFLDGLLDRQLRLIQIAFHRHRCAHPSYHSIPSARFVTMQNCLARPKQCSRSPNCCRKLSAPQPRFRREMAPAGFGLRATPFEIRCTHLLSA